MSAEQPSSIISAFSIITEAIPIGSAIPCERLDCKNDASTYVSGSVPRVALCPSCHTEVQRVVKDARMKILRGMFTRRRQPSAAPRAVNKKK